MWNPFSKTTPYDMFIENHPDWVGIGDNSKHIYRKYNGVLVGWWNPLPTGFVKVASSARQIHPSSVKGGEWWK